MSDVVAAPRSTQQRIALALIETFRPRTDIFAERLDDESRVARINEFCKSKGRPATWRVGNWRPVRKWSDADQRSHNVPLTVDAVAAHVLGHRTLGFYPLHADGTCNSVSIDFDNHRGASTVAHDPFEDLAALTTVCARRDVRFIANVSRGGAGAWLHILPPLATPAWRARALAMALVREAELRHIDDGGSFDALCPKADDVRRGGGGNNPGNLFCIPICGRWLRSDTPGTHLLNTDPRDLSAQLRALTEY